MRRTLNILLCLLILIIAAFSSGRDALVVRADGGEDFVPGEVVVRLTNSADLGAVAAQHALDPKPLDQLALGRSTACGYWMVRQSKLVLTRSWQTLALPLLNQTSWRSPRKAVATRGVWETRGALAAISEPTLPNGRRTRFT